MPMTILYIDDDSDDLEIFQEAIKDISDSINFIPVTSAISALKLLRRQKELPSLIFVDINMPVMNGKEFLRNLKGSAKFRNIPVIMYSTSGLQKEKDECRLLGARDFISKTGTYPELVNKLKSVINGN
jgi:CheY-like chemotaxis protein